MRNCSVPGCRGKFSFNGSKVHRLPTQEPYRSAWLEAVPALKDRSGKHLSVCCLHFTATDYGKNKTYLKPSAVPSRHLNLSQCSEIKTDLPNVFNCDKTLCQEVVLSAKQLQQQNRQLSAQLRAMEKKIKDMENQLKSKNTIAPTSSSFMLGPTQLRCLTNKVSKFLGRKMNF